MSGRKMVKEYIVVLCVFILVAIGPVQAIVPQTLGDMHNTLGDMGDGMMGPRTRELTLEGLLTGLRMNDPAEGLSRSVVDEGVGGVSWKDMVPVNKVTLVGKDNTSYLDEYGYMASVPSSVYFDPGTDELYSNPLLIYEPPEGPFVAGHEPLDDYPSIQYFMDDWSNYTGGIDSFEFVCMDDANRTKVLDNWSDGSAQQIVHSCTDPATVAEETAFWNFEDAPVAVVAVIEPERNYQSKVVSGSIQGKLGASMVQDRKTFTGSVDVGIGMDIFHNFTVKQNYVYISSSMSWSSNGKDPDLQLYDWQLGQAGASEVWNPTSGAWEYISGYLYHTGPWGFGLSYMPTENISGYGTLASNQANYTIQATLYPGSEWKIPDRVPYGATNLQVTVTGDDLNEWLGLIVRDEAGSRFARSFSDSHTQTVTIDRPGQGYYNFTVMKLENYTTEATFNVTWSWDQDDSLEQGQSLTSASHGAVMASALGAPMFYAYPDKITDGTIETMRRLGTKRIVLVDIGNRSDPSMIASIDARFDILARLTDLMDSYAFVRGLTGSTDIVFTSVNDWNYWYINKAAAGVETKTNHIGPATFAAAHHGTAPLIVEMQAETAQAASYFRHYWIGAYLSRRPAVVGDMVLEGEKVYDLLGDLGMDRNGNESMLTVADQFDIGLGFDRAFVGAAHPGRMMGSPTDTAAWVSRATFYPAIIFANGAVDPAGQLMINGSNSTRDGVGALNITPGGEELMVNPIVQSWVCYLHRFNERASKYWGLNYTSADGFKPFWDLSPDPIDKDVNAKRGRPGRYYADMSGSETVPYYAKKAGFDSVFSTVFDKTMEDLNRGSLMWIEIMHGGQGGYGGVGFWGDGEAEDNPWRGYETQGSTQEPDTVRMNKVNGIDNILSTSDDDHDGVVIAIREQSHTSGKSGMAFHNAMDNLHSMGFVAGSCLIAATFLHMAMIRHGSAYQVIDPWLTSWYVDLAIESFMKYLAMNMTVGEAYSKSILHVGIGFLTHQWWWDEFENVVFFGDPDMKQYAPAFAWEKPRAQGYGKGLIIGGEHTPFGAPHHIHIEGLELMDGDDDGTGNQTLAFARMREYTFKAIVRDPDGLSDIEEVRLVSGTEKDPFILVANLSLTDFEEELDKGGIVDLSSGEGDITDDGLCNYFMDFRIEFNWTFDQEGPRNISILALEGSGWESMEDFGQVYEVENDLQFVGNLTAVSEFQGPLTNGDWVRGGEAISWSNLSVSYEGWPQVHPPAGECNITIAGANGTWSIGMAPGEDLDMVTTTPPYTLVEDEHRFSIGGVPEGSDTTNLFFLVRVDATAPSAPMNVTVHGDSFDDDSTIVDNDVEFYITWAPSVEEGSGLDHYIFEDSDGSCTGTLPSNATSYGPCNATDDHFHKFMIGATDQVGNLGPEANGTMGVDRIPVVFGEPIQNDKWRSNRTVIANATLWDVGLSGLSGSSVMYQVGMENDGTNVTWSDWTRSEGIGDAPSGTIVNLSDELVLDNDGIFQVRWKATDLAGNDPVLSEPQRFMIDTRAPTVEIREPLEGIWYDGPTVHVTVSVEDHMSGVGKVQYRFWHDAEMAWSDPVGIEVDPSVVDPYRLLATVELELEEGETRIVFDTWDLSGNSASEGIDIWINMGHECQILDPSNGTVVRRDQGLLLKASNTNNTDGDDLNFTWFSDIDGYIGSGKDLNILIKDRLAVGAHVITLYVDDGHGHNVSDSITLIVRKARVKTGGVDMGLYTWLALLAVIVVGMIVVTLVILGRRKGKDGPSGSPPPPSGANITSMPVQGPPPSSREGAGPPHEGPPVGAPPPPARP